MRVLLTGGAGFLGSHIAESLLRMGNTVITLDDLSTGSLNNIQHLKSNENFSFIEHDVRIPFTTNVDAILNFACPASPKHYQIDPVRTIETNFLGIINMLHLAKETGAIILQASTSEVYGDPTISPQSESYWGNVNPIGPRSCYDEGKRAAETLCFDYKRQFGVDSRVIRIFNTYGPRMAVGDGRVVSNFIVQALQGAPISVYGDGLQTRSFCYVSDLVDGIIKSLMVDAGFESPINLGNPEEFTMVELAKAIIQLTGSCSKIIFEDLPEDDPKQRRPDISLAKKYLDWQPQISLQQGLELSISYFRSVL